MDEQKIEETEEETEEPKVEQEPTPDPPADTDPTPRKIIDDYRRRIAHGDLGRSRTGVSERVRKDLAAYHQRRGWGEPTDEQVAELVREIL